MKEFVEYVIKQLVDKPEEVKITEVEGENTIIYELRVDEEDIGKVIGRSGRTVESLRTIFGSAAAKIGRRSVFEILKVM